MKITVTGGAGFIGSHLAEALSDQGHQVTAIDDLSAGQDNIKHLKAHRIALEQADVANVDAMTGLLQDQEIVFHLAAMNRAGRSIQDPLGAHATNATGTLNIFEAARRNQVRRVIFVSSSSVLGGSEELLTENTPYHPLHPYGVGKATGEMYAKIYNSLYDLDVTVLRYFSIYGPRQRGDLDYPAVIAKFVMRAFAGKPLTIYGDGKQLRNYTYVDDAVAASIKAMESPKSRGRILHVANDQECSILDIVTAVKNNITTESTIVFEPLSAPEPHRNNPDIAPTRELLDWQPSVLLNEGVKRYVQWYSEQHQKQKRNQP